MKILVDSCVWSLSLRRKTGTSQLNPEERRQTAFLADIIRDGRCVLVGPIRQEVLSGVKTVEQFERLALSLAEFPDEPIESIDYVQAARLDNLCRQAGVQCGPVDMLLCAVSIRNKWTILTNDNGLLRCIEVIEQEKIGKKEKMQGQRLGEFI